jgi:hypothetical protein
MAGALRKAAKTVAATALYQASQAGDLVEMRRLLGGGAEPDALAPAHKANGVRAHESTALVVAAGAGQLEAVRLLLDRGADPRLADGFGVTVRAIPGRLSVFGVP